MDRQGLRFSRDRRFRGRMASSSRQKVRQHKKRGLYGPFFVFYFPPASVGEEIVVAAGVHADRSFLEALDLLGGIRALRIRLAVRMHEALGGNDRRAVIDEVKVALGIHAYRAV